MAGFAEDLKRIPMSQGLGATLTRAADYAQAQAHHEVALEHLLLALTEDDDAAQVLAASHVNLALLKADVSLYLGGLDVRQDGANVAKISLAGDLKRILEAAAAAASQGRRREINGAIVLAAIVGDGRSSAAHMLRAQGLTFEEAIKALQRALAAQPPSAAPAPAAAAVVLPHAMGQGEDYAHSKPDAEDILATARARVQTRAAPGLPPLPPRVEPVPVAVPVPVVVPAAVAAAVDPVAVPIVLPAHEAEPIVAREPVQRGASRGSTSVSGEAAAWPPDVRRSDAPDFEAIQQQIEQARLDDEAAERATAEADAAAYEAAPDVPDYQSAVYAEPPEYQMPPSPPPPPPLPPPLMPSSAGPRVQQTAGSRWPAPVAPAWRDQPEPPIAYQHSGFAPPPLPAPSLPPVPPEFAPPAPPPNDWGAADVVPGWSEHGDYREGADLGPPPFHPSLHPNDPAGRLGVEQVYDHSAFDPSFAPVPPPVPPPMSWPHDQVMDAPTYGPDQGRETGYSAPVNAAPEDYHPDWPHREQAPPPWVEPSLQADTYHDGGPGGYVPVPANSPEAAVASVVPRGARRRKADRAAAGQMGESIPRRMRAHVASNVDVRLGRAEMASLLEGLCEESGRDVALASLSVKLRAPDGRFLIDPVSPETQWLPDESGQMEGGFSSWRWTVTPLKSGRRRLQLAVWARTASVDGTAVVTPLPDQTIEVRVGRNFARGVARLSMWAALIGVGWLSATYGAAIYGPVMAEVMMFLK